MDIFEENEKAKLSEGEAFPFSFAKGFLTRACAREKNQKLELFY